MKFNNCNQSTATAIKFALIAGALCLPSIAFGAVNADVMLENIATQLPYLFRFVSGFAYLGGLFFLIVGLYKLKEYGESRTMSSNKLDLKEPISYLIIGAMLIYLPTAKDTMLVSVYGTTQLSPYVGYGNQQNSFNEMGRVIVDIVQFIGFVAFVRGLFLMHRVGVGQAQQGTFNKGLTHLIGGVIAMNVVGFANIIDTTLGISS
jgi:intracellular multiplication protein IcmC